MAKASAPNFRGLPLRARAFIFLVLAAAGFALFAANRSSGGTEDPDLTLFLVAAALCAAGNLYEVFAPGHFSFQPNLAFFFGASLLLPPWAIAVLAVVCFAPGWLMHHFRWYMVTFNIANYILAGLAAYAIADAGKAVAGGSPDGMGVLALAGAAAAFVLINHLLIVMVVTVARGRPLAKSVRDMLECLPVDASLAITGACLAVFWAVTPPLAALAAGPMLLMYRALWVPLLEHKSRTDPKTGLYNSEYLATELEDALAQARRRGMPLAILMIDLDQLRAVNNLHGHLVGDHLIKSVADLLEGLAGQTGLAARFGGDELCLLLPNIHLDEARALAEEVRGGVEALHLSVGENGTAPLTSSVSVGIACYPEHGSDADALLKAADAAVYDAKLGGRNRIRIALPPGTRETLDREPRVPPPAPAAVSDSFPAEELLSPPDPGPEHTAPPAEAERRRWIPWYSGALAIIAIGVSLLGSVDPLADDPVLFGLLLASIIALDFFRLDIFERATISPSSVPILVVAAMFGPVGALAAEAGAGIFDLLRRKSLVGTVFDFGALTLAGTAAAGVFLAVPHDTDFAMLGAVALSGLAYYLVNVPLLAVVMGFAQGTGPRTAFREGLAWLWPHYLAFGAAAGTFVVCESALGLFAFVVFGLPVVMLWVAEKQYIDRSRSSVQKLRSSHHELERKNQQLEDALSDNRHLLTRMHRSYLSTITSLARTIEAKDPYTGGHTERVAQITLMLAEELGFKDPDLRAIKVGALVHDIGKIGVPDQVLLKPGSLNDLEFTEIRRHPEISSYILAELELPAVVKQMVRSHHECWDGSGYPDRLEGEEIPLAARILSVADALDAMTSDRPYRKALPLTVALDEIRTKRGSQFCPRVSDALERCLERRPNILDLEDEREPFDIAPLRSAF